MMMENMHVFFTSQFKFGPRKNIDKLCETFPENKLWSGIDWLQTE